MTTTRRATKKRQSSAFELKIERGRERWNVTINIAKPERFFDYPVKDYDLIQVLRAIANELEEFRNVLPYLKGRTK